MIYERIGGEYRDEPRLYIAERDKDIPPGYKYGPVIRDIFVVEYCIEGRGTIVVNGRDFPIEVGDCLILLPGDNVAHISDPVCSRRCLWCAFDGLGVGKILKRAGITSESPYVRGGAERVGQIIMNMISMAQENDLGAELRRTGLVYQLLGEVSRSCHYIDKNVWVEKALAYMETNYHRGISVSDIAKSVGLDRSYFSILFKTSVGVSPHVYLTDLRVRKACRLLLDEYVNISSVASSVGLDYSNFSRVFKKIVGKTPQEFVKGGKK